MLIHHPNWTRAREALTSANGPSIVKTLIQPVKRSPDSGGPYLVAGGAGGSADGHGDPDAGRGAVEVDQRVAGAVGLVAVGVAVRGRGGLLFRLVGVHVDVVLVAGGVVHAGGGRALGTGSGRGRRVGRGPGVVVGQGGANGGHDLRVAGEDAQFAVVAEAGHGEVLRSHQHPLAGPPGVGDDGLGVDVQGAADVAVEPDVRAGPG